MCHETVSKLSGEVRADVLFCVLMSFSVQGGEAFAAPVLHLVGVCVLHAGWSTLVVRVSLIVSLSLRF